MKTLILTLTCFFVIESRASVVEVIGACDEKPQFVSENILHDEKMTLGDLTIQVLEKNQIPFRGSREGIAAIFDSPTGDEAIEKVSEEEMRFYGWCVHVDGFEPGDMPDEVFLKNPDALFLNWLTLSALAPIRRDMIDNYKKRPDPIVPTLAPAISS